MSIDIEIDIERARSFGHGFLQVLAVYGRLVCFVVNLLAESIGELHIVAVVLFAQIMPVPEMVPQRVVVTVQSTRN